MQREYITIGQDEPITLTARRTDNSLIDLGSVYEGYGVVLYYKDSTGSLAKYSKNAITGYDTLDATLEAIGKVTINLKRSVTINGIANKDVYVVFIGQAADADFEEGRFNPISIPVYCFTFVHAPAGPVPDLNP